MCDNKPADPGFLLPQTFMEVGDERQLEFLREWQHKGVVCRLPWDGWPKEYGGGGVARAFQAIADREMRRYGVPICFNVIGLGWAGPLIIDIGTEQEKARYLKVFSALRTSGARVFPSQITAPTWATRRPVRCAMAMNTCSTARRSGPPWAISPNT